MRTYFYYILSRDGSPSSFEILNCEDDQEAMRRAPALLKAHVTGAALELWDEMRQIMRLDREACPA